MMEDKNKALFISNEYQALSPITGTTKNFSLNLNSIIRHDSDLLLPNFQKANKSPNNPNEEKPISSLSSHDVSHSSYIGIQENCLETSLPLEDFLGQMDSPKLSNKMMKVIKSNANLSESIIKNSFKAVDDSRPKLEDKDLQVELEISELKLHHLERKMEGCLTSSRNTLALNARLSQNVSKMFSPSKISPDKNIEKITSKRSDRSVSPANVPNSFLLNDSPPTRYDKAKENKYISSDPQTRNQKKSYTKLNASVDARDLDKKEFESFRINLNNLSQQENYDSTKDLIDQLNADTDKLFKENKNFHETNLKSENPVNPVNCDISESNSSKKGDFQSINNSQNPNFENKENKIQVINSNNQVEVDKVVSFRPNSNKDNQEDKSNITGGTGYSDLIKTNIKVEENNKTSISNKRDISRGQKENYNRYSVTELSENNTEIITIQAERFKNTNYFRDIIINSSDENNQTFILKPKPLLSFKKLETISFNIIDEEPMTFNSRNLTNQNQDEQKYNSFKSQVLDHLSYKTLIEEELKKLNIPQNEIESMKHSEEYNGDRFEINLYYKKKLQETCQFLQGLQGLFSFDPYFKNRKDGEEALDKNQVVERNDLRFKEVKPSEDKELQAMQSLCSEQNNVNSQNDLEAEPINEQELTNPHFKTDANSSLTSSKFIKPNSEYCNVYNTKETDRFEAIMDSSVPLKFEQHHRSVTFGSVESSSLKDIPIINPKKKKKTKAKSSSKKPSDKPTMGSTRNFEGKVLSKVQSANSSIMNIPAVIISSNHSPGRESKQKMQSTVKKRVAKKTSNGVIVSKK